MHPKHFVVGSLVLFAWALPAAAQLSVQSTASHSSTVAAVQSSTALALTLENAVEMALVANPALRASALDIAIANGERQQASLLPNPSISYRTEGTQRGMRTQTYEVGQLIELGGKRRARIELAGRSSALAASSVNLARTELRANVTAAYFNALGAQELVALAQTSLDIASRARAAAEKRVTAGRISPVEQSRATVAESTARLSLKQAVGEQRIAFESLAAYWGETTPAARTLVEPGDNMSALPSLESLKAQLDNAPQIKRARMQVDRDDAQVSVERAQRVPDITLVVGRVKDDEARRSQTVLGVSVPFPLFNRNQGNLQASLSRAEQARAELDAERLRVNQALSIAYQRAQLGREKVRNMREDVLPTAQQVFDAAVTGFEAGKFGFLDVIDAQRTLLQNRTDYIQALYDSYLSTAEVSRYVDASALTLHTNRINP